jgi:hypothetical protein
MDNYEEAYAQIPNNEIRELLGWMHMAAIVSYRNDEGTFFNDEYYAFWEHYRFLQELAKGRGVTATTNDCPKGLVSWTLYTVLPLYVRSKPAPEKKKSEGFVKSILKSFRRPSDSSQQTSSSTRIILDRPLIKYYDLAKHYEEVLFLCGDSGGAHLIRNLGELGIKCEFLDIPVQEWSKWKSKREYKGG